MQKSGLGQGERPSCNTVWLHGLSFSWAPIIADEYQALNYPQHSEFWGYTVQSALKNNMINDVTICPYLVKGMQPFVVACEAQPH